MMFEETHILAFLGGFFLVAVFFSFITNYLFLKFSFNLGARNNGELNQVRWSANVKPAIGGISFFIIFLISISVIGALPRDTDLFFDRRMIGLIASSSLGFLLGLADDAYNTNPLVKFIGQLSCSFILILTDVYIRATGVLPLDYAITTIWVIGLMNSINMLDNMDAITTTISASIISGIIAVIFLQAQITNNFYLIMLIGVLGSLIGFLFFNWNPSRMYMGDTGSQFLGVFLASSSMIYFWDFRDAPGPAFQFKQFVIPMLMFIVPLVDTTTVTIRRLMRKQSPFVGGKDHITHHLAYLGLSDRQVALTLLFISLLSIPVSLLILSNIIQWTPAVTMGAFLYFALIFFSFQWLYNKGKAKHELRQSATTSGL